ncbi:hypothetical protein ES703_77007 [subsurface metagenome]
MLKTTGGSYRAQTQKTPFCTGRTHGKYFQASGDSGAGPGRGGAPY